jgi:hypothetical protein
VVSCVAGGRALRGLAPSGLVAVGIPAASSLSRIFVRIGNGLNGPTFAIPDSTPGSLDCAASLASYFPAQKSELHF